MTRKKQARKLVDSDAILNAAMDRRLRKQVVVRGVVLAPDITMIRPEEFDRLQIDEQYQRVRIGDEVNSLIGVIRSGGEIPDPIDVSERTDGSWWIVDGQQRFWAHVETKRPIRALVHKVDSIEAEVNLFVALNSRRRLSPRAILKGWPGPAGSFIRHLNTSEKSPLRGMIDLNSNSKLPIDGVTMVKGTLAALTGVWPTGDAATALLPRLDSALMAPGRMAWAEEFARLVGAVFGGQAGGGRVRILPVIALGRVAFKKYSAHGRPVFPSSCSRMRRTNWNTIVPTHSHQYLPVLENEIDKRWR